jgi:serine/threonine protein kinase
MLMRSDHVLLFRTGFEEDKNFHVVLNSVIAGRYHVTEYLGSAAFSKAIQAHDLHTGVDVCIKIIKSNKDFFDQSLDEIKLLKYVNKHDPGDKYHILRLYDYFYYRVSDFACATDLVNTITFYVSSISAKLDTVLPRQF